MVEDWPGGRLAGWKVCWVEGVPGWKIGQVEDVPVEEKPGWKISWVEDMCQPLKELFKMLLRRVPVKPEIEC